MGRDRAGDRVDGVHAGQRRAPKLAATKAYGAQVHLVGETIDDALVAAREYSEQHGAVLIHPFDHADIVAGQATVALEILKQIRNVATIVVPTGGGGLVAGIAAAAHFLAPDVRVIGVQAANAAAWPGSLAAGQPVPAESMSTMADGIAVALPGAIPFAHVLGVRRLSSDGQRRGAVARAVAVHGACETHCRTGRGGSGGSADDLGTRTQPAGARFAVLSGGNIDPLVLTHVITHGLRAAGRYLAVKVTIPDRPGGVSRLLAWSAKPGPACSTWCTPAQHPSWHWTKLR